MTNQDIRNKFQKLGITKEDFFKDFNVSVQNYYRALRTREKKIKPTQTTIRINKWIDQMMRCNSISEYRMIIPGEKPKPFKTGKVKNSLTNKKPEERFNIIEENNKMLLRLLNYYLEKEKQ